jgi:DNA-binding NtrC family response regulator
VVRILVADDDDVVRRMLARDLESAGYRVTLAADGREALERATDDIAVALLDLAMPGYTGLECLQQIKQKYADTAVIVISGTGEVEDAVSAMRQGAFDYFSKPYNRDHLLVRVRQAANQFHLARDNQQLRQAVATPQVNGQFVGKSPATRAILSQVSRVAELDSTVLITGASGTGKTTLARMIHQGGPRAAFPFVAVSCAALPRDLIEAELFGYERGAFTGAVSARPGRAEVAHRGTLFLDEIGDLPLELQPKLLTFLQDHVLQRIGGNESRQVDVRVIAATHQDLEAMCLEKQFRQDLYFRLNVLSMHMPPLAERREDIPDLVTELLERIARRRGVARFALADDAREALVAYAWPGNVRELENVLERATAFCQQGTVTRADLQLRGGQTALGVPTPTQSAGSAVTSAERANTEMTLEEIEREVIRETLVRHRGNKAAAARHLGISEKTIYNKMKRLGLSGKD